MKKIIIRLHPFNLEQLVFVYEDGNRIDQDEVTIDEIGSSVMFLCKKHNIDQIDLTGPKQYSKGVQHKIQEEELTNYGMNKIKINII